MKEHDNLDELAYDELVQRVNKYMTLSSDAYHNGDNEKAAYYLVVAERFSNELKIRVVTTAI